MNLLSGLAEMKCSYDKVAEALEQVKETGYGIVMPNTDELTLEEPEIVKQGGRYGVRLKASAPSIHMIRADIQTEVSAHHGNGKAVGGKIHFPASGIRRGHLEDLAVQHFRKVLPRPGGEDLNAKLKRMPEDARGKLRETLQRIINEGSGGLICIIL